MMFRVASSCLLALVVSSCGDGERAARHTDGRAAVAAKRVAGASPSVSASAAAVPVSGASQIPVRIFLGTQSAVSEPLRVCRGKVCAGGGGTSPSVRAAEGTILGIAVDRVPRRAWIELRPPKGVPRRVGLTPGTLMTYAAMPRAGTYRLVVVLSWPELEGTWGFDLTLTPP